jgi:hypothetical protein
MKQFHHIQVVHLHPNNSTRRQRKGSKYLTLATAYDKYTKAIAYAEARCCETDTPKRSIGYELAVGRVIKQLSTQHGKS